MTIYRKIRRSGNALARGRQVKDRAVKDWAGGQSPASPPTETGSAHRQKPSQETPGPWRCAGPAAPARRRRASAAAARRSGGSAPDAGMDQPPGIGAFAKADLDPGCGRGAGPAAVPDRPRPRGATRAAMAKGSGRARPARQGQRVFDAPPAPNRPFEICAAFKNGALSGFSPRTGPRASSATGVWSVSR